jgi:carbonic anhydrase
VTSAAGRGNVRYDSAVTTFRMPLWFGAVVSLAAASVGIGCGRIAEPAHAPHWTYSGEAGPARWASLSPEFGTCGSGRRQSPIDLAAATPQDLANIAFHYQPSKINILNNGHTVQVNYDAGSYIELDGARYDLAQFHFHAPSEHTINGKAAAAEVHLVHKSAGGQLAVVGTLIESGETNPALAAVWDRLPAKEGPVQTFDAPFSADGLLPADRLTERYAGSLTTPPCSEDVRWNVMTTPIHVSAAQLAALTGIVGQNSRPVQPLYERTVVRDTSK